MRTCLATLACALALAWSACNPSSREGPTLEVDPLDQACAGDGECTMTMTRCSCSCGVPINKLHQQKYLDAQTQMCRGYQGPMCKMSCPGEPMCVGGTCQLVDAGR